MTTGTTTAAPSSTPVATPAAATAAAPDVVAPAAEPVPVGETLTIAGLCDFLRGLDDPKSTIEAASIIQVLDIRFSVIGSGICQADDWTEKIDVEKFTPERIAHHSAISLAGNAAPASALLAALEPCVEKYADVRVCIRGRRAVAGRAPCISIATDERLFKDDPRAAGDLVKASQAMKMATVLVESGTMDAKTIATTASIFMPAHWAETRYCVDKALVGSLRSRLPGLRSSDTSGLFVETGPTRQEAIDKGHGRLTLKVPIPGLTYEMLVEAYGPKLDSKTTADRLAAIAAANVAAAAAGKSVSA